MVLQACGSSSHRVSRIALLPQPGSGRACFLEHSVPFGLHSAAARSGEGERNLNSARSQTSQEFLRLTLSWRSTTPPLRMFRVGLSCICMHSTFAFLTHISFCDLHQSAIVCSGRETCTRSGQEPRSLFWSYHVYRTRRHLGHGVPRRN